MKKAGRLAFIVLGVAILAVVGCSSPVTAGSRGGGNNDAGDSLPTTVSPAPDETSVSVTSALGIAFASEIDPASITDSDFVVRRSPTFKGNIRSGAASLVVVGTLEVVGSQLIFTPADPLLYTTTYIVEITAVVKALDGTILADGLTWEFTTEPAPNIIYLATTGSNSGDCGLEPQSPCATIGHALSRAVATGRDTVAVGPGTYIEQVELVEGVNLYGYTSAWAPSSDPSGVVIAAPSPSAGEPAIAIIAEDIDNPTKVRALTIEAADAVGGNGVAASTYGIYVDDSDQVSFEQLVIVGGRATDGTAGEQGLDAAQDPAPAGFPGFSGYYRPEFTLAARAGGDGGGAGDRAGGAGGISGQPDKNHVITVFLYDPTKGKDGEPAVVSQPGGYGAGGSAPAIGLPATAGASGRTINGQGGDGAAALGDVIGGYWDIDTADSTGATGELGEPGTGGGGGSGSSGYEQAVYDGTDDYLPGGYFGAGGGGGGAGGDAAPQSGTGGTAGGTSFGIFAIDSELTVRDVVFRDGEGGNGGDGGAGGKGQPGGAGGAGGTVDMPEFPGIDLTAGDGGDGGDGGSSGGGGGGAGGNVYGIFSVSSTVTRSGNSLSGGTAGQGGEGGKGPAAGASDDGEDGPNGERILFRSW